MIDYSERKRLEKYSRSCIQHYCHALNQSCLFLPDRNNEADVVIASKRVEIKFWRKKWVVHNWDYRQLKRRNLDVIFATNNMVLPAHNDIPVVRLGFYHNYWKRDTARLREWLGIDCSKARTSSTCREEDTTIKTQLIDPATASIVSNQDAESKSAQGGG